MPWTRRRKPRRAPSSSRKRTTTTTKPRTITAKRCPKCKDLVPAAGKVCGRCGHKFRSR